MLKSFCSLFQNAEVPIQNSICATAALEVIITLLQLLRHSVSACQKFTIDDR